MKIKTLTAPLALAAVLGIGSAAFAQSGMVGTRQWTDADKAAAAEHCRTLAMGSDEQVQGNAGNVDDDSVSGTMPDTNSGTMDGAQPTSGNEGNADNDMPNVDAIASPEPDATTTTGDEGNVDADQFTGSFNMDMITLADCRANGL